jgi:hypothetical protein
MQNLTEQVSREEAIKDVKLYLANDWNLKEETPEYFLLTRNEALAFVPNIVYHFAKKKTKKILK